MVVKPGLAIGKFALEGIVKNVEWSMTTGAKRRPLAVYSTKAAGFELAGRGGLKSVHGIAGQADRRAFERASMTARKFGAVKAAVSLTYSPDDTGSTRRSTFFEGNLTWDVRKRTQSAPGSAAASALAGPIIPPSTPGSRMTSSSNCPPTFGSTTPARAISA